MKEYVESGAEPGWLIAMERRAVEIYRTGQVRETRIGIEEISDKVQFGEFVLDLRAVWGPLA